MQTTTAKQAAGAQEQATSKPKRTPRPKTGGAATKGKQREIRNVFGDAIVEPEQIKDTSVSLAQSNFLDPNLLYQKLQSKSGWTKAMRTHERNCEIQDNFGIMDFSLKAKSRQCKDTDQAYFQ